MYYYRDILRQLFEEFRDHHKETKYNRSPLGSGVSKRYEISILNGTKLAFLYSYGYPQRYCFDEYSEYRLAIVSPYDVAVNHSWFADDQNWPNDVRKKAGWTHFDVYTRLICNRRLISPTQESQTQEVIHLTYNLDPTIDGSDQILAVHIRFQDLLRGATRFSAAGLVTMIPD